MSEEVERVLPSMIPADAYTETDFDWKRATLKDLRALVTGNTSGIRPIEYNVLLAPDPIETRTKGGLIKPDEILERDKHGQTRATIVAVSPMAFAFDDWPAGEPKPQPGDRVIIAKHSGTFCDGLDGKEYRVVKDKDIVAVLK